MALKPAPPPFLGRCQRRRERADLAAPLWPTSSLTRPAKPKAPRQRPAVKTHDAACQPSHSSFVRQNRAACEQPETTSLLAKTKSQPASIKNACRGKRVPSLDLSGCI